MTNLDILNWVGVISGAWDVWLCAREHIWNWPVGLVNCVAFLLIFIQTGLYGSAGMQIIYIGLGIWGWYQWLYGGAGHSERMIRKLRAVEFNWLFALSIVGTFLLWGLFIQWNDPAPLMDAVTTVLSLNATYMLALKIEENWWCWIAADVIFIIMYFQQRLMLISGLYIVFLITCIYGVWDWKRKNKQSQQSYERIWNSLKTAITGDSE